MIGIGILPAINAGVFKLGSVKSKKIKINKYNNIIMFSLSIFLIFGGLCHQSIWNPLGKMPTHCTNQYAKLTEWQICITHEVHPCCSYQHEQQVCHCPVALALIHLHQVSCITTSRWDNLVLSYENWTKLLFQYSAANLHQLPSCSRKANSALLTQRPYYTSDEVIACGSVQDVFL